MKRFISALLCFCLLFNAQGAALADEAGALPPKWARADYQYLQDAEIYPSGTTGPITRGSFTNLLLQSLAAVLPEGALEHVERVDEHYFCDNYGDPEWAAAMNLAAGCGIVQGSVRKGLRYGNFFNILTRQEAAKMVCSTLDFFAAQGYYVPENAAPAAYTDAGHIPSWALPFTQRIAAYGIMVGDQGGYFNPGLGLDWPSAVTIVSRSLKAMRGAFRVGPVLRSSADWSGAQRFGENAAPVLSRPWTGYAMGYYTAVDAQGTVTGIAIPQATPHYDFSTKLWSTTYPTKFTVERFDAQGSVTFTRTLDIELPLFGGFLAGADGYYYLAFGQENLSEENAREVWRIVRYDKDWNRVGAASVTGGASYTTIPFRSAVSRMALSQDGRTLSLHAARQRYTGDDGKRHQSNITITLSTANMRVSSVSGEYPADHVSHSFGQFACYDGSRLVTVDHGDAYPRAFLLQSGGKSKELLTIAGSAGDNVTNAIGSGFELSESGSLFLCCSDPQKGETGAPWNVLLVCTDKNLSRVTRTWLTDRSESIEKARLVKLGEDSFVALWEASDGLHAQKLDGKGQRVGDEFLRSDLAGCFPPTQPAVQDGAVVWIQYQDGAPRLFLLDL